MRSDAGVPRPRLCVGVSSNVKQIRTPTQSRGRGTQNRPVERDAIEAEASVCTTLRRERHRTRERVPEGRGPAFEDAHRIRRCAPKSKSAHLGKPRRFLRRCAAFSKVRNFWCASSRRRKRGWVFRRRRSPRAAACSAGHRLDWRLSFIRLAGRTKLGLALRGPDTLLLD